VPVAWASTVTFRVADVPEGSMVADITVSGGGTTVDRKVNVAPVRLLPCTWKGAITDPESAMVGLIAVIPGGTVKLRLEVAVFPATVTAMGPVVAPGGTVTPDWCWSQRELVLQCR